MMSKLDALYRKAKQAESDKRLDFWRGKNFEVSIVEWRSLFASEALRIYPEIRSYCLELEATTVAALAENALLKEKIDQLNKDWYGLPK
jgi:hypothetical protein